MKSRTSFLAGAIAASIGWGLWESQWVRLTERRVPIARLPDALVGLRIAHLSDLHVGAPALNGRSLRRGVDLIRDQAPDLICVTGDLRARVGGDRVLRRELGRLDAALGCCAILGNHDHADGHDPFADGTALTELDGTAFRLLDDERVDLTHGQQRIAIAGIAPRTFGGAGRPNGHDLRDPAAALAILLCHVPTILDRVAANDWDLILAGHLHGGQICVPLPTGKVRLAHLSRNYLEGVYVRDGTVMHVSRGTGTTFVPIRFAARPEVSVLTLVA